MSTHPHSLGQCIQATGADCPTTPEGPGGSTPDPCSPREKAEEALTGIHSGSHGRTPALQGQDGGDAHGAQGVSNPQKDLVQWGWGAELPLRGTDVPSI